MTTTDALENYLDRLERAISGLSPEERADIVEEIRTHVRERAASSGMTVEEILQRLGAPEELAREYSKSRPAAESWWRGLRATFAWMATALYGSGVLLTALYGYALAAVAFFFCAMKFLFPEQTAQVVVRAMLEVGFEPGKYPEAPDAVLKWFLPATFGIGVLCLVITTVVLNALRPRWRRWRARARSLSVLPALSRVTLRTAIALPCRLFRWWIQALRSLIHAFRTGIRAARQAPNTGR